MARLSTTASQIHGRHGSDPWVRCIESLAVRALLDLMARMGRGPHVIANHQRVTKRVTKRVMKSVTYLEAKNRFYNRDGE